VDDQLSDNIEELKANYHSRLAEIRQLQERAGQVTSTARSRDGLIKLEVGAQGQLRALSLEQGVYERMSPQRLAAALMDLAKTATGHATGQVREIMAPVLPPGMTADTDFTRLLDDEAPPTRPQ